LLVAKFFVDIYIIQDNVIVYGYQVRN